MQEIEFKAWNKIKKEMYYPDDILSLDFNNKYLWIIDEDGDENNVSLSNITLLQYTGLKDKNNKKICEGDIIKFSDNLHGYISFKEGKFIVNHIECVPVKTKDCGTYLNCYEVIGDIYRRSKFSKK